MLMPGPSDRGDRFFFANGHAARAARLQDGEGDRRNPKGLQRVAQGRWRPWLDRDDFTQLQRTAHVVPSLGLYRDDRGLVACEGDARRKPAAPAIDQYLRRRRTQLIKDFQPDGTLPGNDMDVVEARHDGRARFAGDTRR